jgi:spore maturation protein CgeB
LNDEDRQRYGCEVAFIGTWSPKKEALLASLREALPAIRMRIWGCQWEKIAASQLHSCIMGDEVVGDEYAKALQGASICLGILSERRTGASSGDLITSRTFNIPACGAFLLHERNEESVRYFEEGVEAAFYNSSEELAKTVGHYLANPRERAAIAKRGRERCLSSGYSLDDRMRKVVEWFNMRPPDAYNALAEANL